MYCPNCGAEAPGNAAECPHCGTRLTAGEPAPTAPAPSPAAYYPPPPAAPVVPTNGLAIASMVLGLISLVAGGGMLLIPGILALVLGYMARNQIRESAGTMRGDEFAIVGMITGGISLLIGLLACIFIGGMVGFSFCLPLCLIPILGASEH